MAAEKIRPIGSGKPDISAVDAAIVSLSKEVADARAELQTQRSETRNIIIGVVIAFIAIVVTVAVQVILTDRGSDNFDDSRFNFQEKLNGQEIQLGTLKNDLSNLRVRNPYLK